MHHAPCHHATMPPCHHATMPPCHHATMPPCQHAYLPPCLHATMPPCHHASIPPCQHAAMPRCHQGGALVSTNSGCLIAREMSPNFLMRPFTVSRVTDLLSTYNILQGDPKKCLNVRQKLGTRNVLMFKCSEQLLFSCVSSEVSCNYVTCRMFFLDLTLITRSCDWFPAKK